MATAAFDPAAHRALAGLGGTLRQLAGDAAYQAGRAYFQKGAVKQGTVAGTTAYATVSGSTEYRISVAFGQDVKPTCTCPAHRRNKFCKHVVSVCVALLERPQSFTVGEAPPDVQAGSATKRASRAPGGAKRAAPQAGELRAAGLETVDRVLAELADGGLLSLGADKVALLAGVADLVRGLKLRRLGNALMALQRAAAGTNGSVSRRRAGGAVATFQPARSAATAGNGASVEPDVFVRLLTDLYLTRRATGAHLEGKVALDPQLAEDLLGKTWRDEELETASGLEMMELAYTREDDGEFRIETSYLADIPTGALYLERQISPSRLGATPKPQHRQRLLVDDAGLYPGAPPRRLKLRRFSRAPLTAEDVERLLDRVPDDVAALRTRLIEHLANPFAPPEAPVTFRPAALLTQATPSGARKQPRSPRDGAAGDGDGSGEAKVVAVDRHGHYLALDWPVSWTARVPHLLPPAGQYALCGLLSLGEGGLRLRCLSVFGSALAWSGGPVFAQD